jgi:hypothetical protein
LLTALRDGFERKDYAALMPLINDNAERIRVDETRGPSWVMRRMRRCRVILKERTSVDLAADEIIAAAVVPTSAPRHDLSIRFQWHGR